jgi:hypothetical protein
MLAHIVCALLLFSSAAWPASSLTYSTYLRDGFTPAAITTDSAGNVYLAPRQSTAPVRKPRPLW